MSKPNYALLLAQIASTSNTVLKAELIAQCYVFTEELTETEIELFNYVQSNYIEANPGIQGNAYASYVGTYYDTDGEPT